MVIFAFLFIIRRRRAYSRRVTDALKRKHILRGLLNSLLNIGITAQSITINFASYAAAWLPFCHLPFR